MSLLISLIIPTKNEQANIGRCLASIDNNGYPEYEIIVVDQQSSDRTVSIAREHQAKVVRVPSTSKYTPPSASRNIGFKHSRGQIIYHLDADMELEPGLLSEIAQTLSDSAVSAVVVPETDVPANFWARGKALERSFYENSVMEAARATTRKVFAATMYHPRVTSGEDWFIHDQYLALGRIGRTSRSVLHHTGIISLSREFKKKLQYGSASGNYLARNSTRLNTKFTALLRLYFKGIMANIFTSPGAVLAFLVIRLVDALALGLGYLIHRLT